MPDIGTPLFWSKVAQGDKTATCQVCGRTTQAETDKRSIRGVQRDAARCGNPSCTQRDTWYFRLA